MSWVRKLRCAPFRLNLITIARPNKPKSALPQTSVDSGSGVVIVTDMFGGSPSNLSFRRLQARRSAHSVWGKSANADQTGEVRAKPLPEAVRAALDAGRKYIDSHNVSADLSRLVFRDRPK